MEFPFKVVKVQTVVLALLSYSVLLVTGVKSRYTLVTNDLLSAPPSQQDFSDLPFDMPKLRRRRLVPDTACTSGSATSIDFRDLPFDMPKLRRRMRLQTGNLEDSASQASSSQSVLEIDRGLYLVINLAFIITVLVFNRTF